MDAVAVSVAVAAVAVVAVTGGILAAMKKREEAEMALGVVAGCIGSVDKTFLGTMPISEVFRS